MGRQSVWICDNCGNESRHNTLPDVWRSLSGKYAADEGREKIIDNYWERDFCSTVCVSEYIKKQINGFEAK